MKKISVKKIAQEYLKSEQHDRDIFELLCVMFKRFEGKVLTKREYKSMIAELDAAGYENADVRVVHSWIELSFQDDEIPATTSQGKYRKDNGHKFTLFYTGHGNVFTEAEFRRCNAWADKGAPERIAKIEELLKEGEKIKRLQRGYELLTKANEILKGEEFTCFHVPFYYELQRQYGIKIEAVKE